jgi:hypothetical protein
MLALCFEVPYSQSSDSCPPQAGLIRGLGMGCYDDRPDLRARLPYGSSSEIFGPVHVPSDLA